MSTVRIKTNQNIDIDFEIAGIAERIWARLIDLGIFILLFFFLVAINSMANPFGGGGFDYIFITYIIIAFSYPLIMELFFNGQSFGKMALKIKVISLDGSQPSLGQYLIRWIARLVDFTISTGAIGLVTTALTDNNQRVGDLLAKTTVIKVKPRTTLDDLTFINQEYEAYDRFTNEISKYEIKVFVNHPRRLTPAYLEIADQIKQIELVRQYLQT